MRRASSHGKLSLMLGLLIIGLVASACTSALAETAELGAGCDQLSSQEQVAQQADVKVGDLVKVTLCSNPTTGFAWHEPTIADAAVVSFVDKTFSAAAQDTAVVGAGGTETITLKAAAKGTSTVILTYGQPWPGGMSSEWVYTLTVTVS